MKFVKAIVFMSMLASVAAQAELTSGDAPCPRLAAQNNDRNRSRQEDVKTADMAFGSTKSAPVKATPRQDGKATKGG